VVFADPYPGGLPNDSYGVRIFKVNLPMSHFPKVWNMKEWNVAFSASLSATFDYGPPADPENHYGPYTVDFDASMSGKFIDGSYFLNLWQEQYMLIVPADQPADRVRGASATTRKDDGIEYTDEYPTGLGWLFPEASIGTGLGVPDETHGGSLSVSGGSLYASGSMEASIETSGAPHGGGGGISFLKIWVKPNGTMDVYFRAGCSVTGNLNPVETESLFLVREPGPDYEGGVQESVTLSVFGVSVPAKLIVAGLYGEVGGEDPWLEYVSFSSFSFSYDVEVTEWWTY
jgi:hypothetical protein